MVERQGPHDNERFANERQRTEGTADYASGFSRAGLDAQARDHGTGSGHRESADDWIREFVSEHLVHASHFPGTVEVMVDVKDGDVTLSGTVPHRVMKQAIEDMAAGCPGVRHINNRLNVALTAPWPEAPAQR